MKPRPLSNDEWIDRLRAANTEIDRLRDALRLIAWDVEGEEPDLGECMTIAERALTPTDIFK